MGLVLETRISIIIIYELLQVYYFPLYPPVISTHRIDHTYVSEFCTQTFVLEHRLLAQNLYGIQGGSSMIAAWGQQNNINEKLNVILYSYTYLHVSPCTVSFPVSCSTHLVEDCLLRWFAGVICSMNSTSCLLNFEKEGLHLCCLETFILCLDRAMSVRTS